MRNEYLDKVEDNASFYAWSEKTQLEKGDSVIEGYTSELWDFTHISLTQNEFQELKDIWAQWDDKAKQLFYQNYGDLPYLLDIKVDLVPTLEEYKTLLHCPKIQGNKAYVRAANPPTFVKKLMMIIGVSEQWAAARVQQKGDSKCIPWASLRDLILAHPDVKKRKVDKVPCRVFFEDYSPLREAAATPKRDDITEERWIEILQNLQEEDVMWKAHWMTPSEILYRCGSFDWGDHYKKKIREISEAWKKICCVKILTEGPTTTLEYKEWFSKRINDTIPRPSLGAARSMEESLRVIPTELKVIKQEFERKNLELRIKIGKLEEENMYLSLDVDVHRIEVEKERKEKRKIEEDRDDLKTRNSAVELKASLDKIEEMKHNIGGLEAALQDCELRIEQLEAREEHWKGELHHFQDQVRDRGYLMGEAIVQIREVADHLHDLTVQANVLSTKYELVSDKGLELALLLDRVKTLSLKEKTYF
ncbi:hypothetical protein PVK06_030473 [Gossypium arboreum]|uniref:Uncharacterized protein n=1 Tax=Gossypium arboreum TaxID=29729 RepID=A0ABR0NND5_GOSAR|nr:hypothetical protein PVK06_030473 [Gossypium arboreum]